MIEERLLLVDCCFHIIVFRIDVSTIEYFHGIYECTQNWDFIDKYFFKHLLWTIIYHILITSIIYINISVEHSIFKKSRALKNLIGVISLIIVFVPALRINIWVVSFSFTIGIKVVCSLLSRVKIFLNMLRISNWKNRAFCFPYH